MNLLKALLMIAISPLFAGCEVADDTDAGLPVKNSRGSVVERKNYNPDSQLYRGR